MKISPIEVTYIQHCGSDLMVANAARVSMNKESKWDRKEITGEDEYGAFIDVEYVLKSSDAKLIKYLATHKHFSPFNHSFITVRVKAPIFCSRQLVKHKFMPINEVSRRYVSTEPEFYFPDYWRKKADNVKQGSSDDEIELEFGFGGEKGWPPHTLVAKCLGTYNELLEQGVCAEQARFILPLNMMTEWYWSGTLNAFCDMLRLRLDAHTQRETQEVAKKILDIVLPLFPVSVTALLDIK